MFGYNFSSQISNVCNPELRMILSVISFVFQVYNSAMLLNLSTTGGYMFTSLLNCSRSLISSGNGWVLKMQSNSITVNINIIK